MVVVDQLGKVASVACTSQYRVNINSGQLADLRPGLGALDEAEPTDTMNPHLSIRVSGASYLYIVTIISRIHSMH